MPHSIPQELYYSPDHEWVRVEGEDATIGITAFAAGELGDIVFVDVPRFGQRVEIGAVFGTIEAVKTVSDLFMPVTGTLTAINPVLNNTPELVNQDPYGDGWLIRIRIEDLAGLSQLMKADDYQKWTGR